jgi:hypothetical protein
MPRDCWPSLDEVETYPPFGAGMVRRYVPVLRRLKVTEEEAKAIVRFVREVANAAARLRKNAPDFEALANAVEAPCYEPELEARKLLHWD